jgi:hypothetical protein
MNAAFRSAKGDNSRILILAQEFWQRLSQPGIVSGPQRDRAPGQLKHDR